MVGNRDRRVGTVADVRDNSSAGASLRSSERGAWQIGAGGTVLVNMRTDPPPQAQR